ncbi:acyl-CoA dehydrogenase family protein [Haloechinothrix salitolerans]|uniref:Acyl-CoA dehydrogenase family protein n=1 Tax=Haloechinothrix salitolerans TaxID=926830 RepID=A0ABW2C7M3_9PSEU
MSPEEKTLVQTVRTFVDKKVKPVVWELEAENTYPEQLIDEMKDMGIFGLLIDEPYSPGRVSATAFAMVTEQLARGWMSLAGAMGGHSVVSYLIGQFGTDDQKQRYLPQMATGELRSSMALTEPGGGSDLQAMRTVARRDGDEWVVTGSKTWITNARRAGMTGLLCKTDPNAQPAHTGVSILLAEKAPGFQVSRDLPKLGYRGIETCELVFDDYRVTNENLLGGTPGRGFAQMMRALEVGRIQVAARAVGLARAAFEEAVTYAQEREAFGRQIWRHQSVGNYLAEMATSLHAARALTLIAASNFDSGKRSDLEAGAAKLFATEMCVDVCLKAMRVHGGYGYSKEFNVERYFRDAPLLLIGEGTNEIQKNVIARQVVERRQLWE